MEHIVTANPAEEAPGYRLVAGPGTGPDLGPDPGPDPDPGIDSGPEPPGRLAANLMHFARTLRAAGLPVGSGAVLDALRAVEAVGLARRDDFYWTLHAAFVRRREHRPLFDEAFHVFWRNPRLLERVTSPPPSYRPYPAARRRETAQPAVERSAVRGRRRSAAGEGGRGGGRARRHAHLVGPGGAAGARLRADVGGGAGRGEGGDREAAAHRAAGSDPALPPASARIADRHADHLPAKPPDRFGRGPCSPAGGGSASPLPSWCSATSRGR